MKLVEGFSWHRVLVRSTEWLVSLNVLKGLNKDSARPHMWQAAMVEVCSKLSVELVIVCTRDPAAYRSMANMWPYIA